MPQQLASASFSDRLYFPASRQLLVRALCAAFYLAILGAFNSSGWSQTPDPISELQQQAIDQGTAAWGHWGPNADKYSSWTTHSNRLVPIYTFGQRLDSVRGKNSVYRNAAALRSLYDNLPAGTLNPNAEYFDQTDVHRLQQMAIEAGKKKVVLMVFDGMDWQTTRAAAIAKTGKVLYESGVGTGLAFQDYDQAPKDYGYFVSSPHNNGTRVDVNQQQVANPGGNTPGGYDAQLGGASPWSTGANVHYLISDWPDQRHAYTDSAASATSMTTGRKTYNNAINVDASGREILPIARVLQEQGFAVGAITSVPISHATPACSYANNVHRSDYQDLTRDMLGLPSVFHPGGLPGLDVLIGAGWGEMRDRDGGQGENFVAGNRYLAAEDLESIDAKQGGKYVVAQRTAGKPGGQLLADAAKSAIVENKRLFGFFGVAKGHLPFQTANGDYKPVDSVGNPRPSPAEVYSKADVSENPTLANMTAAALDVLQAHSDRWWLMIEPGDVDWANHSNNIDDSIGAVFSGEAAFETVTQWIEQNSNWEEALVIVTADHGHYFVLDQPEALTAAASGADSR